MIDPTSGPTAQDLIIGVDLEIRPGSLDPVPENFNWAEWRIDADLSALPADEIGRLNREFEGQVGQLRAETIDGSWSAKDWFALTPDAHERDRLEQQLAESGVKFSREEITAPEQIRTQMREQQVTDRAEIPYLLES